MATTEILVPEDVWTLVGDDGFELLVKADAQFWYVFSVSDPSEDMVGYIRGEGQELIVLPPTGTNLYVRNRRNGFTITVTPGQAA